MSEQILSPRRFCPPGHNLLAEIVPHGHNPLADIVPPPQKLSPFPPSVGDRYSNTYIAFAAHCMGDRCSAFANTYSQCLPGSEIRPILGIRITSHKLTAPPAFCIGPETYHLKFFVSGPKGTYIGTYVSR